MNRVHGLPKTSFIFLFIHLFLFHFMHTYCIHHISFHLVWLFFDSKCFKITYKISIGVSPFASHFNTTFSPIKTVWFCVTFVIKGNSIEEKISHHVRSYLFPFNSILSARHIIKLGNGTYDNL